MTRFRRCQGDATPNNADEPETLWVSILAFGQQTETLARHAKGEMLAATGRLTQGRWTTQGGEKRTELSLIADTLVSSRTVRPGGGVGRRIKAGIPALRKINDSQPKPRIRGLMIRSRSEVPR